MEKKKVWIGGNHSVIAAINNKSRFIYEVVVLEKNSKLDNLKINYKIKNKKFFTKIFNKSHIAHQGIAVLASIPEYPDINIIKNEIKNVVILDNITDPMNIGTIIRNCVAFNIEAIIINERDFNDSSSSMLKASSGAIEKIKICKVKNLMNAVRILKKENFWIIGLDSNSKQKFENHSWNLKNAFIFGSEGQGIKKILKENCDYLLKININNNIESLNVSSAVSASLAIFNLKNEN